MAFQKANLSRLVKFNSDASCALVNIYEDEVKKEIAENNKNYCYRTFSPSSFRCERVQWFRLRGVEPETPSRPDLSLNFTAKLGTACHEIIQMRLIKALGADWIAVPDYLKEHPIPYEYELSHDDNDIRPGGDFETRITISDPPIRLSCDGILRILGEYYLLEIKSSELKSFDKLTEPKPQHVEQAKTYGVLLGLHKVLFMYIDRQFGGIKVFEMSITEHDRRYVRSKMGRVMRAVEANVAPSPLQTRHIECSPNTCPYYKKCLEWG